MSVAPSCSVLFKAFYAFTNVAVLFVLGYFWTTNDEEELSYFLQVVGATVSEKPQNITASLLVLVLRAICQSAQLAKCAAQC